MAQAAQEAKRLENLETRHYVNKYYDQKGKRKPWYDPVKCLCKGKDVPYTHGRFVECGRWTCQKHVDDTRKNAFEGGVIVHERRKNTSFWRRMRAANSKPIYAYAKKHGLSYEKAALELEYFRTRENEIESALRIESEFYYDPSEEE